MAKQKDNKDSGNDGSWFLEAVGAVPPAPTPSETVAALESENTVTDLRPVSPSRDDAISLSAFDGGTGTSTSTFAPPTQPERDPLDLAETPDPVHPSVPSLTADDTELSSVLRTRRPFRWPAIFFAIFVVAVGALTAIWLPAALRQEAAVSRQAYADASLDLRQHLPTAQSALDLITNLTLDPGQLSSAVPTISQLDSFAHDLSVVATDPTPAQLPLFPIEEVTALAELRDTAQIQAAQGSDVARQLGHAYVYRTTIPSLLATGELPTNADVQTINSLSVALASTLVSDSTALADLPTTEATADLNAAAFAAVERYATWQDEYLAALTEGNADGASVLIDELDEIRDGLSADLVEAMGTVRVEIDQRIVELATNLESFLERLTRA